ncbi:hypothetical protein CCR75_000170 [Bremia lactucae]|uniref:Uncharacterized protein n=1 Tax=Bremia lactucae TaxID=4779 RepID=A0A976FNU2_BRELC|nr:hypothetical protein CCR75_000170 [Bremia lactucae]
MHPNILVASVQQFDLLNHEMMPIEDRLYVKEGHVRGAAVSPHCLIIIKTVLSDSLTRLDQALEETGAHDVAVASIVCSELQVFGKVMRFVDRKANLNSLESHTQRFEANEAVITSLFVLYGWCLQTLMQDMAPELGGIATSIVRVFEQRRFVARDASAEIVESFFVV